MFRLTFTLALLPFLSLLGGCVALEGYDYGQGGDEVFAPEPWPMVLGDGFAWEGCGGCIVTPYAVGGELLYYGPGHRIYHRGYWDAHRLSPRAMGQLYEHQQRHLAWGNAQQRLGGRGPAMGHPGFAGHPQGFAPQRGFSPSWQGSMSRPQGVMPQMRQGYPVGGFQPPQPQMQYRPAPQQRFVAPMQQRFAEPMQTFRPPVQVQPHYYVPPPQQRRCFGPHC